MATRVPFTKPALSVAEQIAKLKQRGLAIPDEPKAAHYLRFISYYRLGPYFRVLQDIAKLPRDHAFRDGASFDDGLSLYIFDRELRLHFLDAIERIEVAVRTVISNHMALSHGAHWFLQARLFDPRFQHSELLGQIEKETGFNDPQRQTEFSKHYYSKYSDPPLPPSWMIAEVLPLGAWSKIFANLNLHSDKQAIANSFKLKADMLRSWLHTLTILRNVCAHHSLLWNRRFPLTINQPVYAGAAEIRDNGTLYPRAVIVQRFLSEISRDPSTWAPRLLGLIQRHPDLNLAQMGFPCGWEKTAFWKR